MQTITPSQDGTRVVTGKVRASYCSVFTPRLNDLSGNYEYSMAILIPKSDTATVQAIANAAIAARDKKWPNGVPDGRPLRSPLRDGDDPNEGKAGDPAYQGHWFANVKSKEPVGIVDASRLPITDGGKFVSGDYCRVSLNAYGYDQKGNRGVALGLNNVQMLEKGEPLTSRTAAEDDFGDVSASFAGASASPAEQTAAAGGFSL